MDQHDGSKSGPFAKWQIFGLPAFASALAPWYGKLIDASLIPEWYTPSLNIVASVLGPLVCFILWLTCANSSRHRVIGTAFLSLATFVLSIAACLVLTFTVDIFWYPDERSEMILRLLWPLAYLMIFVAFSSTVVSGLLLMGSPDVGRSRR
ncbi:hypothetical protein IAG41_00015 [Sphingomonas sp. JC676]|uniref:hypothetical protein n=1 Tax=Sphingomonas sp. JC676 TaxID=2768065 RepID=UPI0016576A63|nr:hypothetical protein [Sphingomonas sp. JC676]MBC9030765.1 hypothetical protein [Sphingomonas sp. JC676]